MTRGVVAWFDEATESRIRALWAALAELGVPSLGSAGSASARPHVSYLYDDNLDVDSTLAAMAELTPLPAVEVRLGAVALFPPRVLHLSVVPTAELLSRHARVFEVASPGVPNPRAYHRTGRWNPHVTMARSVPRGLLGEAVDLCATYLPIEGRLETGGIEDATSGESWIAAYLP